MQRLLLATNNPGKVGELRNLLSGIPIDIVTLADVGVDMDIAETGATFAENAALKSSGYAQLAGVHALADDSGLEVSALGGRPGVYSARYGGKAATFVEKMELLLAELKTVGDSNRAARFVASMALSDPSGEVLCCSEGICEGRISDRPRGSGGFGFDPLFVPDGFDRTFGELPESVKQATSHRYRAFCEIIPFLRRFLAV